MNAQELLDTFDQFCALATEEDQTLYNKASQLYWTIEPYLVTPESVLLSVGRAHANESPESLDLFRKDCLKIRAAIVARL